ncbi:MAG: NAD(P)-dependent oxidoreductase [Candidatus Dormiibacterota bacterium]
MSARVAILGTGKMGSALARRLAAAGMQPTLWNRTRARAEQVAVGQVAATAAAAVRDSEIVISSLTGADAVLAAFGGPEGALAGAAGQLFVEMSTAGPDLIAELEPLVRATGSALVDAPITGSPPTAESGGAAILIGGAPADVERARPVLEQFGTVRHVGPLGNGARLKLVANSMLGAVTTAAAELQTVGVTVGLAPQDVLWVLAHHVPGLELRKAGYLEGSHQPALFALRDLRKDLDLALELFHRSGGVVPVTALVREQVGEAAGTSPDLDISGVMTRYRSPDAELDASGRARSVPAATG